MRAPPSRCFADKVWREEGYDERDRAREEADRQEAAAEARRAREEFAARSLQQRLEKGGTVTATQAPVVEVRAPWGNTGPRTAVLSAIAGECSYAPFSGSESPIGPSRGRRHACFSRMRVSRERAFFF